MKDETTEPLAGFMGSGKRGWRPGVVEHASDWRRSVCKIMAIVGQG